MVYRVKGVYILLYTDKKAQRKHTLNTFVFIYFQSLIDYNRNIALDKISVE